MILTLEEKLIESGKDVISINDYDACCINIKKVILQFDYNGQIAVDKHK